MRKNSVFMYVLAGLICAGAIAVAISLFGDPEKTFVNNSYVTPGTVETTAQLETEAL